jgi:hypothetical protein
MGQKGHQDQYTYKFGQHQHKHQHQREHQHQHQHQYQCKHTRHPKPGHSGVLESGPLTQYSALTGVDVLVCLVSALVSEVIIPNPTSVPLLFTAMPMAKHTVPMAINANRLMFMLNNR